MEGKEVTIGTIGLALFLASAMRMQNFQTCESLFFAIVPRQAEAQSCGYAVLAGLIGLIGPQVTLETDPNAGRAGDVGRITTDERSLIKRYGDFSSECARALSFRDMIVILADYGIPSAPFRLPSEKIKTTIAQEGLLILHYAAPAPHFVLALGEEKGFYALADPADGLMALSAEELTERISGYALIPLVATSRQKEIKAIAAEKTHLAVSRRTQLEKMTAGVFNQNASENNEPQKLHGEFGFSTSTSLDTNNNPVFSPTIFFSTEWALSETATILGEVHVEPVLFADLSASTGMEWHHSLQAPNRNLSYAFIATVQRSRTAELFVEPRASVRYSLLSSPFLLTGQLDIAPSFLLPSLNEVESIQFHHQKFSPSFSASCVFSSVLACKTSLRQSFSLGLAPAPAFSWTGEFEIGLYTPVGRALLYSGVILNLDVERTKKGEAIFSITL